MSNTETLSKGSTSMINDLQHDQQQVVRAVEDFLRTPLDSAAKMDVNGAAMLIATYVFHDQIEPSDAQRYEWYYMLLGKSVSIAQAWKQNFAGSLNLPSETRVSIIEYIDSTYGTYACTKAGIE